MMVRFVAVGELLVDVIAAGEGHDARIRVHPGGSAYNAAVTAAAAGAQATAIGTVGDDPAGHMIVGELEAHDVRAKVTVDGGKTGVFVLSGGEILVDRGVSHELTLPDTVEADAVLVSGYLPSSTIAEALARARASWVALDAARLERLPPGGNALIADHEAAGRLTGREPEAAVRLLGEHHRLACVTSGPLGAVAVLDGELERARVTEPVDRDTPGSGDAFAAVLLIELARGAPLAEALAEACRWGARAAALGSRT